MNSTQLMGWTFPLRLIAYLHERFPPSQMAGAVPMFLSAFLAGQAFAGVPPAANVDAVVGFLAFFSYTFSARAVDDHKDFDHDTRHYPERVLQRGLITLSQLKVLGLICYVVSFLGSVYIDRGLGRVTWWWVVQVVAISAHQLPLLLRPALMEWLEERRVLLAFTILPFWGLGGLWIAQMGAKGHRLSWAAGLVLALWMTGPLLLEIVRKSRAPEDDRPTVASYIKPRVSWAHSLGLHPTVAALILLVVLNTALEIELLRSVGYGSMLAYAVLAAISVVCMLPGGCFFIAGASRERAKTVAELAAITLVLGQIVLVIAMLAGR